MSHTSEVSNIVFADIPALRAAVNELASRGIKCALVQNATPRAYFANQQGMGAADYVLQLHDAPYDVGFYKNDKNTGYVARTDLFAGHVGRILGAAKQKGESDQQAALGKLNQTYAVHAAMRKAVAQGMSVTRVNNADGSVRLVVGGIK